MENPFTLTFGQKPTEFISRTNQIGKIIHTFDMENPSNKVYMVAALSGDHIISETKTVQSDGERIDAEEKQKKTG